jgi:hypothetical protein
MLLRVGISVLPLLTLAVRAARHGPGPGLMGARDVTRRPWGPGRLAVITLGVSCHQ